MKTSIKRSLLLRKLETVAPALSDNALIPALTHVWFMDKHLMTYNDRIGIKTPLDSGIEGAVPGNTLLELVKATTATDLELEVSKNNLLISAGKRNNYHLPLLPKEAFVFEMPKPPAESDLSGEDEAFFHSIKVCMRSVSTDTSVPEQLGITLIPNSHGLAMFASDNATLSHSAVKLSQPANFERVVLSQPFCEQMLRLRDEELQRATKTQPKIIVAIRSDHAIFVARSTILFGKLIDIPRVNPLDFEGILEHHLPKQYKDNLWIPDKKKMEEIINIACILTATTVDQTHTRVTLKDGNLLQFYSKSDRGEARDDLKVPKSQKDVTIRFNPALIKSGLPDFSKILFTNECVIMTKDEHIYLVGTTKG